MRRAAARPLVSEQDFLALPESTRKIELLDGEVVVSARCAPGRRRRSAT